MVENLTAERNRARWLAYLGERTSTYSMRVPRFAAVSAEMCALGFESGDLVVDVGAGSCEFDRYLRTAPEPPIDFRYLPVCGAVQGVDLDDWRPSFSADFFTAIEVLEHLRYPQVMLAALRARATKGVVITTPNPETVDVLAIDRTHVSPIPRALLEQFGFTVRSVSLFGKPDDTLFASLGTRGAS